jgi:hypothetical protein
MNLRRRQQAKSTMDEDNSNEAVTRLLCSFNLKK